MPMTVRLSARTERAVDALARRRRQTRSDVVRDALEHYTAANGSDAGRGHPYDAWLDVIGMVGKGGVEPATRGRALTTGERFTAMVREKAHARRARRSPRPCPCWGRRGAVRRPSGAEWKPVC